jgi:uncharacterized protein (TIGR02246 family)
VRNLKMGFLALWAGALCCPVAAWGQTGNEKEEKALLQRAEAFVAAFDKGDAKALAGFWTPTGIFRDQKDTETKGREAIEKAFQHVFAENKGLKLRINVTALRFVTNDVAVEEGTTEVLYPDGAPPSVSRYTNLHVKKDGQWHLDIVKNSIYTPPTNYKQLSELEWAIGDWADEEEKGNVGRLSFSWGPQQNFIIGTYATTFKNISLSSGTQWIGWDPKTKHIRSWAFDDSGTFGEGSWTRKGDKWIIKTHSTLRDGKSVTATNIVTVLDAQTISWQSTERTVDGKALPDTKEIKMKRVK